jgi:hypothetical protein
MDRKLKHQTRNYIYLLLGHTKLDYLRICAGVAELADALGLGPSGRKAVGVQVPSPAPLITLRSTIALWIEGIPVPQHLEFCPNLNRTNHTSPVYLQIAQKH